MNKLDRYERKLLAGWEEIYKKGQLTLWTMLALKDGPKHMTEIKQFMAKATKGALTVDDKSMYRALRRYYDAELVNFKQKPGKAGPDFKIYYLSDIGKKVLNEFIERNITNVFYKPEIKALIGKV